jgi:hypothetical protein
MRDLVVSDSQLAEAKADFRKFLYLIWKYLLLPNPTPLQYDMAYQLQHGPRAQIVEAFRGCGKSWVTSAFVLWLLWNDPNVKILVVSASKDRADAFSTFTKRLIGEVWFLKHLRPEPKRGQRDSNVAFDVGPARASHSPSVKSGGITGQITGGRADFIICDDVEVPNNTETLVQREKLAERVAELGGAVLMPVEDCGSQFNGIVFLGTPQCEDSLYVRMAKMRDIKGDIFYQVLIWPAEVPDSPRPGLAPMVQRMIDIGVAAGTPVDPQRFNLEELAGRKVFYGKAGYQLQFMLDTNLSDAMKFPLRLHDLIVTATHRDIAPDRVVWSGGAEQTIASLPSKGREGDRFQAPMHTSPEWTPFSQSLMYVDPSGRGRDETGYVVLKFIHGMIYIRAWGGLEGGYSEPTLARLATIAWDERVNLIVCEANFGGGMFSQLLKPAVARLWPMLKRRSLDEATDVEHGNVRQMGETCRIEDDTVSVVSKEVRICDALEPVMGSHRIVIDEALCRDLCRSNEGSEDRHALLKDGFYQLTHISREKGCLMFDDRIDVLAGGVKWFQENMAQRPEEGQRRVEESRREEALREFVNAATGKFAGHGRSFGQAGRRARRSAS